jgi:hypothetical protein
MGLEEVVVKHTLRGVMSAILPIRSVGQETPSDASRARFPREFPARTNLLWTGARLHVVVAACGQPMTRLAHIHALSYLG